MKTPDIHQWTHDGKKVLLVKCLDRGRTGNDGRFTYPPAPAVGQIIEDDRWDGKPTCDGGGFFGWAWGIGVGDGRAPDACAPWLVIAADPIDVVGDVDGGIKCKCRRAEIIYDGDQAGAMYYTSQGRIAWIQSRARGSASATGDRGSASATGRACKAKGAAGCALFLIERNNDWTIAHVWAGVVGKNGIKPGVFYQLQEGVSVETT